MLFSLHFLSIQLSSARFFPATTTVAGNQPMNLEPPSKRPKMEDVQNIARSQFPTLEISKGEFEGAFSTMLRAYSGMNAEEKAEKTRKLIRALGQRELEMLEELFDILGTAGVKTSQSGTAPSFTSAASFHNENCAEDCPHKEELMRIDQFYNEVFF